MRCDRAVMVGWEGGVERCVDIFSAGVSFS